MTVTWSAANWRFAGACRSADPDLFFPVPGTRLADKQIARAKAVCAGCAVRQECLEFALAHSQIYGIWGGTTVEDRRRARRRRRRAAAPSPPGEPAVHGGTVTAG
jgi:WhiB family transcriptional regulator, redox-sensing transcriptional regulator